jgi:hypothetical protein
MRVRLDINILFLSLTDLSLCQESGNVRDDAYAGGRRRSSTHSSGGEQEKNTNTQTQVSETQSKSKLQQHLLPVIVSVIGVRSVLTSRVFAARYQREGIYLVIKQHLTWCIEKHTS